MAEEVKETVKGIKTDKGTLPIDYNYLANLPLADTTLEIVGGFADAQTVGKKISDITQDLSNLNKNSVPKTRKINEKPLDKDITLAPSDIGASEAGHTHDAGGITSGKLSMERGGTNAENGQDGLKNLLAAGHMILSSNQYGTSVPPVPEKAEDKEKMIGRIFFVKMQ